MLRMSPERQTRFKCTPNLIPGKMAGSISFTMDEENTQAAKRSSLPNGGFSATALHGGEIFTLNYIDQEGTLNLTFGGASRAVLERFVAPASAGSFGVDPAHAFDIRIFQTSDLGSPSDLVNYSQFHLELEGDVAQPSPYSTSAETNFAPVWVECDLGDPRDKDETPIIGTGNGDFIDASGFLHRKDGTLWHPAPTVQDAPAAGDPKQILWTD